MEKVYWDIIGKITNTILKQVFLNAATDEILEKPRITITLINILHLFFQI